MENVNNTRQGDSGNLETTRGRFFLLRLLGTSPFLLNKVCFGPKMVRFLHIPTEKCVAEQVAVVDCIHTKKNIIYRIK